MNTNNDNGSNVLNEKKKW